MWREVVELLSDDYDVVAPDALGHKGGPLPAHRPASISDVVDAAERQLDERGFEQAHLAGNSMGGWMALELARRGRALSVCALAPAGFWASPDDPLHRGRRLLVSDRWMGHATRPLLAIAYRSRLVRRFALRHVSADGALVPAAEALAMTDDMLACTIALDILRGDECFARLDPVPCPTTVVWCERDPIFPSRRFGERTRALIPGAECKVLDAAGHVPMLDSPARVAETIRVACQPARLAAR